MNALANKKNLRIERAFFVVSGQSFIQNRRSKKRNQISSIDQYETLNFFIKITDKYGLRSESFLKFDMTFREEKNKTKSC